MEVQLGGIRGKVGEPGERGEIPPGTPPPPPPVDPPPPPPGSGEASWNPNVSCLAQVTTIHTIVGNLANSNGGATLAGGGFDNYVIAGHSTSIDCGYAFVQLNGVTVVNAGRKLWTAGDGDACIGLTDAAEVGVTNPYLKSLHAELDFAWHSILAPGQTVNWPAAGTLVDVQGFVAWDPNHVDAAFHFYSGWEIHPVTAWRLS